ncbi:MAG: TIGR04086 family membrane protein [Firmicutes bacterium]|nr:TIGR04086 family membrane protein [Bacillota bacterium]
MRFKIEAGGSKAHKSQQKGSVLTATVKGLAIAIAAAVVASLIISIILVGTNWLKLGPTGLLLINYLSIAIGGVYASRSLGEHGWLVGLSVGVLYGLLSWALGLGRAGLQAAELQSGLLGLGGAAVIGTLAGMVGVNLK